MVPRVGRWGKEFGIRSKGGTILLKQASVVPTDARAPESGFFAGTTLHVQIGEATLPHLGLTLTVRPRGRNAISLIHPPCKLIDKVPILRANICTVPLILKSPAGCII